MNWKNKFRQRRQKREIQSRMLNSNPFNNDAPTGNGRENRSVRRVRIRGRRRAARGGGRMKNEFRWFEENGGTSNSNSSPSKVTSFGWAYDQKILSVLTERYYEDPYSGVNAKTISFLLMQKYEFAMHEKAVSDGIEELIQAGKVCVVDDSLDIDLKTYRLVTNYDQASQNESSRQGWDSFGSQRDNMNAPDDQFKPKLTWGESDGPVNYYRVLGIPNDASNGSIISAFSKMYRDFTSIVNKEERENVQKEQTLLLVAQTVLLYPQSRKDHDKVLEEYEKKKSNIPEEAGEVETFKFGTKENEKEAKKESKDDEKDDNGSNKCIYEIRREMFTRMERLSVQLLRKNLFGKTFKDYEIFKRISSSSCKFYGEDCISYLCCVKGSNQIVVLKIFQNYLKKKGGIDLRSYAERVRNVVKIPFHPNVVSTVHSFLDEIDFKDYLITPSLPEELRSNLNNKTIVFVFKNYPKSLKEVIRERKGRFEAIEFLQIAEQLLEGICHLYDSRIIHRDLSPDSVFVDERGKIVIGGFNFAVDCSSLGDFKITKREGEEGSTRFLAPEILKFDKIGEKVDYTKNDVYSVGLICHALVSSYSAFPLKGIQRSERDYREIPSSTNFSKEIKDFVRKMTNEAPRQRFSCKEALDHCKMMISKIYSGEMENLKGELQTNPQIQKVVDTINENSVEKKSINSEEGVKVNMDETKESDALTMHHDNDLKKETSKSNDYSEFMKEIGSTSTVTERDFICPITGDWFVQPTITPCGHTFSFAALRRLMWVKLECPLYRCCYVAGSCRKPLTFDQLKPDKEKEKMMKEFMAKE